MARRREIDPTFFLHEALYEAERSSGLPLRLAFSGLWCVADREGRFEWRPVRLKLGIMPFDTLDFGAVLDALAHAGFLVRYVAEGREYGVIPTFKRWQRPHPREAKSRIPAPSADDLARPRMSKGQPKARPRRAKSVGPSSLSSLSSLSGPSTKQDCPAAVAADLWRTEFEAAWGAYPKRPNNPKAKAWKAYRARRGEGVTASALLAGVEAYARYCERESVGPQFVKLAATFFGKDEHWLTDYGVSDAKVWPYLDDNGVPGPDGTNPNPAFLRMAGRT